MATPIEVRVAGKDKLVIPVHLRKVLPPIEVRPAGRDRLVSPVQSEKVK